MNCPYCHSKIQSKSNFCSVCGKRIPDAYDGVTIGDVGMIRGETINIGTGEKSDAILGDHCPICGSYNPLERTFRCANCGRSFICKAHQDQQTFWCVECCGTPAAVETEDLFQINYQYVYPFIPKGKDALAQVVVNFTSRSDIDFTNIAAIPTHLTLVLDVSGSMNKSDKYPLLRQAIPFLINALSDDDYLTIILFSDGYDIVFAKRVSECRGNINPILEKIDKSGVIFGRQTLLAPALKAAINEIKHQRKENPLTTHRLYVLTDGELHDVDECFKLNPELRSLETEFNSYGFGEDFAFDTLKHVMEGVPGGTVKPLFNTKDVKDTFSHIGDLAERIVAQNAEFSFKFNKNVIAGDAFRYQPGTHYFGPVGKKSQVFKVSLGSLERDRIYTFYFEGRVHLSAKEQEEIGEASLRYRQSGQWKQINAAVYIKRTDESWRIEQINDQALKVYYILNVMRRDDPDTQLKALYARQEIYEFQGADPILVELVERAIDKLERGQALTEEERRNLRTDRATCRIRDISDELEDMATSWLQKGYSILRVKWLSEMTRRFESEPFLDLDDIDESLGLERIEIKILKIIIEEEFDPFEKLGKSDIQLFDDMIKTGR